MPRRKWTTEEQYEWLSERIPDFVEAQQTGTVSVFITSVTQKWYQEWPPGEPTEDEVEEAKGSVRAAKKARKTYWEKVSTACYCSVGDI